MNWDIRKSFVVQDRKMLLLSLLIVLMLSVNLGAIWHVLEGDVVHRGILPVTGVLLVLWFVVWAFDLTMLQEPVHYFKDTIFVLAGMVAASGFLLVTIVTEGYKEESSLCLIEDACIGYESCIIEEACIDHAFTVPTGFTTVIVTSLLFAGILRFTPRILFTQSYSTIQATPVFAAWGGQTTDEEDTDLEGMPRLQETSLRDVRLDNIVDFQYLSNYHMAVLPVLVIMTVATALIWNRIPNQLHGPYSIEYVIIAAIALHLIFLTAPRMFAIWTRSIMDRMRHVTYAMSLLDGVLIGVLGGIILLHPSIPVTGAITKTTTEYLIVATVTLIPATVMPMLLHFVFMRE